MDKNSIWLVRLAAGIIILTSGIIPFIKLLDDQRKNDLVIKTDLNEKYILRATSLSSFDFSKEDLIKILEEDKLPIQKRISKLNKEINKLENEPRSRPEWMEEKIKGCNKYKTQKKRDYCINVYTPSGFKGNIKSLNAKIYPLDLKIKLLDNKIAQIKIEQESILFKGLKFRPIYQDLNGIKTTQGYEKVACENNKVDQEVQKFLNNKKGIFSEMYNEKFDKYPLSDGYVVTKYDNSVIDSLKISACKKYAKFEE